MYIQLILNYCTSQKGAIDRVLVSLLLIVIGIIAVIGIETWTSNKKNDLLNEANNQYQKALEK